MRQPVKPRLRSEGPQLRIAVNEHEGPREKKTYRPSITNTWPSGAQPRLRKNKNSREHHKKPGQVMIEFALTFVRGQFFRRPHRRHGVRWRRSHVHSRHVVAHSLVARLTLVSRMILRANQRLPRPQ